jgi:hypothetical protein
MPGLLPYLLIILVALVAILYLIITSSTSSGPPVEIGDIGKMLVAIPVLAIVVLVPLAFILPLVLPVILSQRRWLSVGRWAALAGFFLLASCGASGVALALRNSAVFVIATPMWFFLFTSSMGCLLAAALHPK